MIAVRLQGRTTYVSRVSRRSGTLAVSRDLTDPEQLIAERMSGTPYRAHRCSGRRCLIVAVGNLNDVVATVCQPPEGDE